MNKENRLIISRKYARAFVNVFANDLNFEEITDLENFISYLNKHTNTIIYIKFPLVDNSLKRKVFYKLLSEFKLSAIFKSIIDLLVDHNRIILLPYVLKFIAKTYRERFNIIEFNIISSHELTQEQINKIIKFLEKSTNKKVTVKSKINPSLIAGLRIYSSELGWEHSIREQLNLLSQIAY